MTERIQLRPGLHPKWVGGLDRYLNDRILPGDFLTSVLQGNLKGAVLRADPESIRLLPDLVRWMYDNFPAVAWGNELNVACHLRRLNPSALQECQTRLDAFLLDCPQLASEMARLLTLIAGEESIEDGIKEYGS